MTQRTTLLRHNHRDSEMGREKTELFKDTVVSFFRNTSKMDDEEKLQNTRT